MINKLNIQNFKKQLDFIIEVDKLKQIIRQTLLTDSSRQENDAEHSWHMALAIFIFQEHAKIQPLDMVKAVKMVLIHDVVEIDAGDTFAYDLEAHSDKEERENKAAERIFGLLPEEQKQEYINIWREFEEGKSNEAKFVGAVDKFMPILHNYLTQGKQWKKHGVSAEMVQKRNSPIQQGSDVLWEKVLEMIEEGKEKGFLK